VEDSLIGRALSILRGSGFSNVRVDSVAPTGPVLIWTVALQDPQAGTRAVRDTLIRLTAADTIGILVPHLVGVSEQKARDSLPDGLRLNVTGSHTALRVAGTVVASQAQRPDSLVAPGTSIDVTLANPIPVVVTLGAGLAGLAGAVAVAPSWAKRWLFHVRVRASWAEDPDTSPAAGDPMIKQEVSFEVTVGIGEPEWADSGEMISQEEPYHGPR
jgi:hypothetical protein